MSGITYKELGDYLDLKITIPGLPPLISGTINNEVETKLKSYRGDKNPLNNIKQALVNGGIKFDSTEQINKETLKKKIFPIIKPKISELTKGLPGSVADSLADSLNKIIDFLISIIEQPITQDNKDSKIKELTDIIKTLFDVVPFLQPLSMASEEISTVIATSTIGMFMAMGDATAAMGDATAAMGDATAPAPGSALGALGSAPVSGPDAAPAAAPAAALGTLPGSDESAVPADTSGSGSGSVSGTKAGGASRRSRCPRGSRRNKKTGDCVKVAGYTAKKRCPRGTRRSKTTGACEKFKMLLAKVDSSKRKTSAMLTKVADEALSEVADLKKADTELAAATKKCCAAASAAAALKRQKKTAANKARLDGKIAAAVARAELADKLEKEAEKDRADILAKIARLRKVMGVRKNEENPVELKRLIQQWTDESRVRIWKMSKE
jgi:hypothetical protein